jgi:hypothetical protein
VSPGLADASADATLACEHDAALRVAAWTGAEKASTRTGAIRVNGRENIA